MNLGILGSNGIVGAGLPIAVGAGFACKSFGKGQVCACFFGDGASNRGTFHESLNMAAEMDLPVIYVLENSFFEKYEKFFFRRKNIYQWRNRWN